MKGNRTVEDLCRHKLVVAAGQCRRAGWRGTGLDFQHGVGEDRIAFASLDQSFLNEPRNRERREMDEMSSSSTVLHICGRSFYHLQGPPSDTAVPFHWLAAASGRHNLPGHPAPQGGAPI